MGVAMAEPRRLQRRLRAAGLGVAVQAAGALLAGVERDTQALAAGVHALERGQDVGVAEIVDGAIERFPRRLDELRETEGELGIQPGAVGLEVVLRQSRRGVGRRVGGHGIGGLAVSRHGVSTPPHRRLAVNSPCAR